MLIKIRIVPFCFVYDKIMLRNEEYYVVIFDHFSYIYVYRDDGYEYAC